MNSRDMAFRAVGAVLVAAACAVKTLGGPTNMVALALFAIALIGVALVAQGERLPHALGAERRRQRHVRTSRQTSRGRRDPRH